MSDEISPAIKCRTSCVCVPGVVYARGSSDVGVCAPGCARVWVCTQTCMYTRAGVPCVRVCPLWPGEYAVQPGRTRDTDSGRGPDALSSPASLLLGRGGHASGIKKRGGGGLPPMSSSLPGGCCLSCCVPLMETPCLRGPRPGPLPGCMSP